jgi:ATP-binding cassette subfamily B protein
MIKLLCRLYDPTDGVITLNGIDIKKYSYDEYIKIFSVVFQDFCLLDFPLGQNVAASAEYNPRAVSQALEKTGFGGRLKEMEKGLDTPLNKGYDEGGVIISGGEAQKIALARAIYKGAEDGAAFVILDEA